MAGGGRRVGGGGWGEWDGCGGGSEGGEGGEGGCHLAPDLLEQSPLSLSLAHCSSSPANGVRLKICNRTGVARAVLQNVSLLKQCLDVLAVSS